MKNCSNKIKSTCGSTTYATCTTFEGTLPDFSELTDCVDLDQTTTELYSLVGEIKEETDLSELGNNCLEYVETEEGKIVVKNVLLKFEEKICELQERILELEERPLCSLPISDCIDTLCLEDACNNTITTFGEWMNAVTVKICETP